MFVLDQYSLRMSLISKENLSNVYLLLYSMFDEFGLRRGATFFRFVGISRDYRHKIRLLNAERRGICAVGSDLTVMSDPSPINTDPPHRHSTRNSLDFILSALEVLSRAPLCCSSPSTLSPLCCRKKVTGDLPRRRGTSSASP